jgi:hypothetical protein
VLHQQADMVNAVRVATVKEAYRPGHRFGNVVLTSVLSRTFGDRCTDLLLLAAAVTVAASQRPSFRSS